MGEAASFEFPLAGKTHRKTFGMDYSPLWSATAQKLRVSLSFTLSSDEVADRLGVDRVSRQDLTIAFWRGNHVSLSFIFINVSSETSWDTGKRGTPGIKAANKGAPDFYFASIAPNSVWILQLIIMAKSYLRRSTEDTDLTMCALLANDQLRIVPIQFFRAERRDHGFASARKKS